MVRSILFTLALTAFFASGCSEKAVISAAEKDSLQGTWVQENDPPGRMAADTLHFSVKNGRKILSFYSDGSPGPNWPSHAETEYRFDNGQLSYQDYSGSGRNYIHVESFQWITPGKAFSVKLYQIVGFMSADYRVTYKKVGN